jgi:GTP-binding protein HflX
LDLLDNDRRAELSGMAARDENILMISAETGEGIDVFKAYLAALIAKGNDVRTVKLRTDDGAALAWLHGRGVVSRQYVDSDIVSIEVSLSRQLWGQFEKQFEKQIEQAET